MGTTAAFPRKRWCAPAAVPNRMTTARPPSPPFSSRSTLRSCFCDRPVCPPPAALRCIASVQPAIELQGKGACLASPCLRSSQRSLVCHAGLVAMRLVRNRGGMGGRYLPAYLVVAASVWLLLLLLLLLRLVAYLLTYFYLTCIVCAVGSLLRLAVCLPPSSPSPVPSP